MKVLFLTNVPSPYRVDFFNELGKMCELTVLFEKRTSDERDSSWKKFKFENFNGIFLNGKKIGVDNAICLEVVRYLKKNFYDYIIISDFLDPTGMIAIEYMRLKRIPYWLESDGGIAKNGKGFSEKVKKYFISGAAGYFSTSEVHDKYYIEYGADKKRIHRYPFTSYKKLDLPSHVPSAEERNRIKAKHGMKDEFVVLSVGRFSYLNGYGKGYDTLMRVAERLREVRFCIVGDTPTTEFSEWKKNKNLDNVTFVGFKSKEELKEYYLAADLFVLMTVSDVWGLVINEAMMYGLPIITTNMCVAGTELVRSKENGFIVPVGDDHSLEERIKLFLNEPELLNAYGEISYKKIQNYTIESMALEHMKVFEGE